MDVLELGLATLDRRRHRDQPIRHGVGDRGRLLGRSVLGGDREERAGAGRVDLDTIVELLGRIGEAELRDHGLEILPRLGDDGVGRGQVLRDEHLREVGVGGRERLPHGERDPCLVHLRLGPAHDERDPAGRDRGHDHQGKPGTPDADEAANVHEVGALVARRRMAGTSCPARCDVASSTAQAPSTDPEHTARDRASGLKGVGACRSPYHA